MPADFNTEIAEELRGNAEILEKTASYISELETKLNNSEAKVAELTDEAAQRSRSDELEAPLSKLAEAGYTESELEELSKVGPEVLTKLASRSEAPDSMGESYGTAADSLDPLTQFLMS